MPRLLPTIPALIVITALACGGGGCASVQVPRQVADPVTVFVTDYGIHSAIVLPVGPRRYVEYAFGDYGYAALNRDTPFDALGALLVSRQAGFGRSYMAADPATGLPALPRAPLKMHRLTASRAKVEALLADLEARYDRGRQPAHFNEVTGIHWVRDRQRYGLLNSCNHLTARSLEALGCRVYGLPIFSKFQFDRGTPIDEDARHQPTAAPANRVAGPM